MRKSLVTDDEVARIAWDTYSKAVGGKAFNGDPLPTWDVMCADEKKENLVVAWKRCARAVATHVEKKLPPLPEPAPVLGDISSPASGFKVTGTTTGRATGGGVNLSSPGVAHSDMPAPIRTLAVRAKCCGSTSLTLAGGKYSCPCGGHVEAL
jgi:hypothetical protein